MASLPLVAATLVVQASQRRRQHPQEQVGGTIPSFCRGSVVAFVESKQTICGRCFCGNAPETQAPHTTTGFGHTGGAR